MEALHYSCHIHNHADIGTIGSSATLPSGADSPYEIDLRSCGQRRQHGLSMPVVHDHLIGVLHQTGCLQLARLVETFLINLDLQTAREKHGALMKRFGVVGRNLADFTQKSLYTHTALACGFRSCAARTNAPGFPCTADRKVLKSPGVCGARKKRACCASSGTVTTMPSLRTCRVHVSAFVNHLSGGGFVAP